MMGKSKKLTRREKIAINKFEYVGVTTEWLDSIDDSYFAVIEDGLDGLHVVMSRSGIDTTKYVVFSGKYFKKAIRGFGCIVDDIM